MLTNEKLLVLIDGHALVYRAFHAIRIPLTTRAGEPTTAVYGFTSALLKAFSDLQPSYVAVAFDHPAPTFRSQRFEAYKAQRPPMPDELRQQLGRVRQVVETLDIASYELGGYEADDILGCLARQATEKGLCTIIVTGDTDLFQLASPSVDVLLQRSLQDAALYTESKIRERYGLDPAQIIDYKALVGDPSDNIPGVPLIGGKYATELLQAHGTVEGIYENLAIVPSMLQKRLRQGEEAARQGKELVTIVTDLPLDLDLEEARWGDYDRDRVLDLFRELEFSSLLPRLPRHESTFSVVRPQADREAPTYQAVTTREGLEALARSIREAGSFAFDVETTSTNPLLADLVGIAVAVDSQQGYYIPVGHRQGAQLPREEVLAALRPLFETDEVAKIAHNGQYDISVLANDGVPVRGLAFDTMLAAHFLGDNAVGLKPLSFQRLQVEMTPITDLLGRGLKQLTMDLVPIEQAMPYAGADAVMTFRLWEILQKELRDEGLESVFQEVEMPLVPVLMRMEREGIALDGSVLAAMALDLRPKLQELEERVHYEAGEQFNLNSTQQLAVILFDKLGLPHSKRTKTGYSTDVSVLEGIQGQHPIIDLLLDYRQISKLLSTYVDALPAQVNSRTGLLHTRFNQTGSATGRVASNDPNLQNIPVRTELGNRIRNAFIARSPDKLLLAADYSQVELRVLAHLSRDPGLIQAFENDEDIHASTASEIFGMRLSEVTADMRRMAKAVNFGIAYGLTSFGLASRLDMDFKEAATYIDTYFQRYPKVQDYIEETKEHARSKGYVQTLLGRRRYIPEIGSSNPNVRSAAERMAVNMPVQGTAADIIKIAMVRLQERLDGLVLGVRMLLQIHDELIFELPVGERDSLAALVQEVMPNAMALAVPLTVDIKTGANWGELE